METAVKAMGYKTTVRSLSFFHDDYGLEGDDEDDDEDGSEEGSEDGSEGSDGSEESA